MKYGIVRVSARRFMVIKYVTTIDMDEYSWKMASYEAVDGFNSVPYAAARGKLKELAKCESREYYATLSD